MKIKLKPCPFCGCKPRVTTQQAPTGIVNKYGIDQKYSFCGVTAFIQCDSKRCKVHPGTGGKTTAAEPSKRKRDDSWRWDWRKDKAHDQAIRVVARIWNRRARKLVIA